MTKTEVSKFREEKYLEYVYEICKDARSLESKYLKYDDHFFLENRNLEYNLLPDSNLTDILVLIQKIKWSIFENNTFKACAKNMEVALRDKDLLQKNIKLLGRSIEANLEVIISECCKILELEYDSFQEVNNRHHFFDAEDTIKFIKNIIQSINNI